MNQAPTASTADSRAAGVRVLELNDLGISLGDEQGVLARSPGYAVIIDKQIHFGQAAAAQSRIHPVSSNNEFWHRLSMDPLTRPFAHFRHYADIAYSHLQHLIGETQAEGEVIVAVPGSMSRQQLAVLLGLMKQSALDVVALVDSGLLAGAAALRQPLLPRTVHADIQLHLATLSVLGTSDGQLQRESTIQIPGVGWAGLADALAQLITDAFIRQSRFNPQHNARWEQTLYDSLPRWLGQESDAENNLLLEIQTDSGRFEAKLTRAGIASKLQPHYRKIINHLQESLEQNSAASADVLLSDELAALPGFRTALESMIGIRPRVLSRDAVLRSGLQLQEVLRAQAASSAGQGFTLITRLPLQVLQGSDSAPLQRERPASAHASSADLPTHVLIGDHAWPIGTGVSVSAERGGNSGLRLGAAPAPDGLGEIGFRDGHLWWQPAVDDGATAPAQALKVGDLLQIGNAQPLRLIRVRDGQG